MTQTAPEDSQVQSKNIKLEIVNHRSIFDFEKIYYKIKSTPYKDMCLQVLNKLHTFSSIRVFSFDHKDKDLKSYLRVKLIEQFKETNENQV